MSQVNLAFGLKEQTTSATAELSRPVQVITAGMLEELRATMQSIAADDAELRGALLNDAKATVAELVRMNTAGSYEMPDALEVHILEDSNKVLNIVIPSVDKLEGVQGEIADFARALDSNPTLLANLKVSPRETLEAFMKTIGSDGFELPDNKGVRVVIEKSDELYVVLPESPAAFQDMIRESEIGAPSRFDPHMSCFTCECFSNGPCFTGQCFTGANCFSYSQKC